MKHILDLYYPFLIERPRRLVVYTYLYYYYKDTILLSELAKKTNTGINRILSIVQDLESIGLVNIENGGKAKKVILL